MNGLSLRINSGGKNKSKNTTLGLQPTKFDVTFLTEYGIVSKSYYDFMNSNSVDEQMNALKLIIKEQPMARTGDESGEDLDDETDDQVSPVFLKFVVNLFLNTENKHVIKCFLTKYIVKTKQIHYDFTLELSCSLDQLTSCKGDWAYYTDVSMKIASCIENFPPGEQAVRMSDVRICQFLTEGLQCCVDVLRTSNLAPSQKTEIYNTSHLLLRLINNIISKSNDYNDIFMRGQSKLNSNVPSIRCNIKYLLRDADVPMDTKSLCGIVIFILYMLEGGDVLDIISPYTPHYLRELLTDDVSALCVYSAVTSSHSGYLLERLNIEVDTLEMTKPAIVIIGHRLTDIGNRNSSEPPITLAVSRAFLSISRLMPSLSWSAGVELVAVILHHVWTHHFHHLDSVRHHAAQTLTLLVSYCCKLNNIGFNKPLDTLLKNVLSLERNSRGYYLGLISLVKEFGATFLLDRIDRLIQNSLAAVNVQAVQASCTTFLEALLDKHAKETSTGRIFEEWIEPILDLISDQPLEPGTLNIMETLVVRAVNLDVRLMDYIKPALKKSQLAVSPADLKRTLMLMSVVRKSNVTCAASDQDMWKGIIEYRLLRDAGTHIEDDIRILSLTLIVESNKSTEPFSKGDLDFMLHFLKYNINSQSANFRQIMLSQFKKSQKRLQDSHRVLSRQGAVCADRVREYTQYVDQLRRFCLQHLDVRANYGRKYSGLHLLLWSEEFKLDGYANKWRLEECRALLNIFEDTFESIQTLALDVWRKCSRGDVETVVGYLWPAGLPSDEDIDFISRYFDGCERRTNGYVTAAYVLRFVDHAKRTLQSVQPATDSRTQTIPDAILLKRFNSIIQKVTLELGVADKNILVAASKAPMYGYLHILTHLMKDLNISLISCSDEWRGTFSEMIDVCVDVSAAVADICNNESPEGYFGTDTYTQLDNGDAEFECEGVSDRISAQAVLVCAWRSVKEVSLLLGEMTSVLSISREGATGLLTVEQVELIGAHLMELLTRTKHRGAFEQAYVGFTMLCNRLWRCRDERLVSLPRRWAGSVWSQIRAGHTSATRRSAGLPYIVQALVTTELQVTGNTRCFHESMTTLLKLASDTSSTSEGTIEDGPRRSDADCPEYTDSRVHSLNILRALYRNTALGNAVTKYIGEGFIVAIRGFDAESWAERNASTLLFSALMVRTFGVTRSRDLERLERSNKMTGRIFFLRYPELYDFILDSLKRCEDPLKYQSVGPLLDVLARLYPSSLEGTHSNLKLSSFVSLVCHHDSSAVMKIRISAARALVPLLSPAQVFQHIMSCFLIISEKVHVKRNQCHGLLLQLTRLLNHEELTVTAKQIWSLFKYIKDSIWILDQAADQVPCYVITDEYIKVLNLLFMRFPQLKTKLITSLQLEYYLDKMIFNYKRQIVNSGREICLSNAVYLNITVKLATEHDCVEFLRKTMSHDSYDVKLATINFLLILLSQYTEKVTDLQKPFESIRNRKKIVSSVINSRLINDILEVYDQVPSYEIKQKLIKLLFLFDVEIQSQFDSSNNDWRRNYLGKILMSEKIDKSIEKRSDKELITDLIGTYNDSKTDVNFTEYMLPICIDIISNLFKNTGECTEIVVEVLSFVEGICKTLFSYGSDVKRSIIGLLESNMDTIVAIREKDEEKLISINRCLYLSLLILLNDDETEIRGRTALLVCHMCGAGTSAMPTAAVDLLNHLLRKNSGGVGSTICDEEVFSRSVNSYAEPWIWADQIDDIK